MPSPIGDFFKTVNEIASASWGCLFVILFLGALSALAWLVVGIVWICRHIHWS